jgi:FkbM family methyltransferase
VVPAIEHYAVLRNLNFDFVVDVGANRGQFSLVCRSIRPAAPILAFEPLTEPARIYRAVFGADPKVRLHVCALAPLRGEITINVSGRDDYSSLLPISKAQADNFPGTGQVGVCRVSTGPLPDFVQPSDLGLASLLKIDVQGFELEVLKSAEELLARFRWIYVECSFVPLYEGQALAEEIVAWLAARGFRLAGRFNSSHARTDGRLLQADLLFENSSGT